MEMVAGQTGIRRQEIEALANEFAWAKAAFAYGRVRIWTQRNGTITACLARPTRLGCIDDIQRLCLLAPHPFILTRCAVLDTLRAAHAVPTCRPPDSDRVQRSTQVGKDIVRVFQTYRQAYSARVDVRLLLDRGGQCGVCHGGWVLDQGANLPEGHRQRDG